MFAAPLLYYAGMRALLASATLSLALPVLAGDINMNLTNPDVKTAPASAAPAGTGAAIKSLDASLNQAAGMVKELEGTLNEAAATIKSAGSEKPLSYRDEYIKKIRSDCRSAFRPADVATAASDLAHGRPVSRYLACLAAASRTDGACSSAPQYATKTPDGGESPRDNCIDAYYFARFADVKAAGGDASAVCRQGNAARGGANAAECAQVAALNCTEGIDKMSWIPYEDMAHCRALFSVVKGNAKACDPLSKYDDSEYAFTCKDIAAIVSARKGGSCGGSALCQAAMTGKAESCAPLYSALREAYCDTMARGRADREEALIEAAAKEWRAKGVSPKTQAMNVVVERRKAVDALLVAIGQSIDTFEPKTDPAFPPRAARYRALRSQADGALKRFKAATEPKAPAPAKKAQ